ncbi:MAG: extracellular solute-binding protein [Eubacteriales bacterium]|nr:extracellular solute-binding protein [Eubacteriales bacterium]
MKRKALAWMLSAAMTVGCLTGLGATSVMAETDESSVSKEAVEADESAEKTFKILSIWAQDTREGKLIYDLTKKYQEEVNPNFEFEMELVSSNDLTTKISTLIASNDLPDAFAYVAGQPLTELIEAGKVVDIGAQLEGLGVADKIEDSAKNLLKDLSGTESFYDLPLGLNVEGFWYNKQIFEDNGVEAPQTWDELISVCDTLMEKGVQPIAVGGADKWPLSRIVNAYVIRTMGIDALTKATSGELSFTDEGFVKAAQEVADMAEKGYFGEGCTTVDNTTAANMVLAGEAAMIYNGSWYSEDIASENNPAGEDGIGFFSIPTVEGGVGEATEIPTNCGNILTLSADKYDGATAGWLKYFVENAGDYAMTEMGSVKGYTYDATAELSPVNQIVVDTINNTTKAATWFEAMMNNETKTAAQDNVQTLVNGEMTAEEYMQSIQDAYDMSGF